MAYPLRGALIFVSLCFPVISLSAQRVTRPVPKRMSAEDQSSLRVAIDAYDRGDAAHAEPVLHSLAQRYPANYEINEALGSLYAEANQLDRALPFLERSRTIAPREALAHANLGAVYLKLARPDDAVTELRRAATIDPRNPDTQSNLGQALMLQKQPAEAAKAFAAAAQARPEDNELKYNLALALYESGASKQAAQTLDAIPETSMTAELHSFAGDANEHAGEFAKALKHFQTAASVNPSDANLYALTVELLRHWNWDEAIEIANFGTSRYPASTHFRTLAGIAYYAKGDYAAAVGVLSKLLQQDPENALVADLLGRSCGALGDGVNAGCAVVGDFAQKHPGNAVMTTYAAIAILHAPEGQQNLDKAATLLKEAIASDPKYAEAYLRMGVLEQTRLHWAESTPYLERCAELNPTGAEAHYRLSRAYAHLGRSQDAQAQIALHQRYSRQSKDSLDSRMQEVMRFILSPSGT